MKARRRAEAGCRRSWMPQEKMLMIGKERRGVHMGSYLNPGSDRFRTSDKDKKHSCVIEKTEIG